MAYLKKNIEEEGVKNVAQGAGTPVQTAPRTTSDQTAAIQPGQSAGQAPGAAPSGPSPTGYIPLQQYLQANVGAGAGVKNILGSQVQQAASGAEKEISGVQETGTSAAKQAQTAAEQQGKQTREALAWDPTSNVEKAKGFLEQTYTGPEASPYAAKLKAAEEAAKGKIGLLSTEEGKQAAIQAAVKGPYTAGYGSLDRYLFAQDPGAKAKFAEEQRLASDKVYRVGAGAQQAIDAQVELAKQKLKEQQSALKESAKTVQSAKTQRAQAKVNKLNKEEAARAAAFAAKEQEQGRRITDKNWTSGQAATLADVLSDKGLADIEALSQISGMGLDQGQKQKGYKKGQGSYTVKV